ncbi:MAG: anthranilate synthase component I family protein [Mariprofundales bacterium]
MYHNISCSLAGDSLLAILKAHPQSCAGLFAQLNMHWLYSSAGLSHSLYTDANKQEISFFFTYWQQLSNSEDSTENSPTLNYVFYAAYEAGGLFENLPPPVTAPDILLWLHQPEWSIALDTTKNIAHIHTADNQQLFMLLRWLQEAQRSPKTFFRDMVDSELSFHNAKTKKLTQCLTSDEDYKQAVRKVREYIRAGDIFQANIARFWHTPYAQQDLLELYACLRQVNPAPYGGFWRIPNKNNYLHIISASPERLLRLWPDGRIDTRPIAGTRKRGDGLDDDDDNLRADLLLSTKERAEHIMLVDLERNDLGKVCQSGSVYVDELMSVEKYATVQHIVSNICGRLQADKHMPEIFSALFPGGTITGCPKIRCMQIINELEPCARSVYTGSMGFVTHAAYADVNILIRTFWHTDNAAGGQLHWAAGAGIVADSEPDLELKETDHKAAGLLRALFYKIGI